MSRNIPFGVIGIQRISTDRTFLYKTSILALTFVAYMCYHISRKSFSIVKSVLHNDNCTSSQNSSCGWAPFDHDNFSGLFGMLDSAFLFSYAINMFVSGIVAERVDLRYFLTAGMISSGAFAILFGLAKTYNIHSLYYFVIVQALMGMAQTSGWPAVVAVIGNWFGKSKRGLIFGIWNSHTSLGNIFGSLIAGKYVETDWSLSFIVPGLMIIGGGLLIFLFMVVHPQDVNCSSPQLSQIVPINTAGYDRVPTRTDSDSEADDIAPDNAVPYRRRHPPNEESPIIQNERAIGFLGAFKIPGVLEFSLSLFFAKLVSYTFLFWLPLYINESTKQSASLSAELSTLFDVGGIVGGIFAGYVSDVTNMPATTCTYMFFLAAPALYLYSLYGASSLVFNILLLLICGSLVNGPYALITTAVAAELGTHSTLEGNSKALATVTAIIDGTGSIGAAVGPLLAALVSSPKLGFNNVFYILIASDVVAMLLLGRLTFNELKRSRRRRTSE